MRKLLNPDTPIDTLFQGEGKECTYVGSLPREKVLNKILYLDQLLFLKEASNCPLTPADLEADARFIEYQQALLKGTTEREREELYDIRVSWATWVQDHLNLSEPILPGRLLNKYFSTFDPHLCSDYQTKPQCNAITQGAACYS